jgi:hypothetical protein
MTRRKHVVHEYATDRGRTGVGRIISRSQPKDKSLKARVKVSQIFIDSIINYR